MMGGFCLSDQVKVHIIHITSSFLSKRRPHTFVISAHRDLMLLNQFVQ